MSTFDPGMPARRGRRHPSAGNLGARPVLVRSDGRHPALPSVGFPHGIEQPVDRFELGPDLDHDALQRLLGNVSGRRVLELGCASGASAVALARMGARVIVADPSGARLVRARSLAEEHKVKVEFHESDLADLAYLRADTIDACVSVYALAEVPDVARVFRQVHRVLKRRGLLLFSLPHPITHGTEPDARGRPVIAGGYPPAAVEWDHAGHRRRSTLHTIGDVVTFLARSDFAIDQVLEPFAQVGGPDGPHRHPARGHLPETVVYRARKLGV